MKNKKKFEKELENLLNKYSAENESSTPDYILAKYIIGCLDVYNKTVVDREGWFGRGLVPCGVPSTYNDEGEVGRGGI
jgi:hypothetical protein